MIKVLLAEDHALVRDGIRRIINEADGISITCEATCGQQVLDALNTQEFDLLILDLCMPGLSGPSLIHHIRCRYAKQNILAISAVADVHTAKQALIAGSLGYLTKDTEPKVFISAVRAVAAGCSVIDPKLAEKMSALSKENKLAPHEELSRRELEIFRFLAGGLTVMEIAEKLSISDKTVSTHKARLMQKMGFSTSRDLILYAARYGMINR